MLAAGLVISKTGEAGVFHGFQRAPRRRRSRVNDAPRRGRRRCRDADLRNMNIKTRRSQRRFIDSFLSVPSFLPSTRFLIFRRGFTDTEPSALKLWFVKE